MGEDLLGQNLCLDWVLYHGHMDPGKKKGMPHIRAESIRLMVSQSSRLAVFLRAANKNSQSAARPCLSWGSIVCAAHQAVSLVTFLDWTMWVGGHTLRAQRCQGHHFPFDWWHICQPSLRSVLGPCESPTACIKLRSTGWVEEGVPQHVHMIFSCRDRN